MQGKHMVLQLDKKPPASYLGADGDAAGRPVDMAVVLRVEALDQEGLLHRLVDRIRALCKGQHDDDADGGGAPTGGGGGGARLEQYGLRGHTGSAIMEFLIAGAKVRAHARGADFCLFVCMVAPLFFCYRGVCGSGVLLSVRALVAFVVGGVWERDWEGRVCVCARAHGRHCCVCGAFFVPVYVLRVLFSYHRGCSSRVGMG